MNVILISGLGPCHIENEELVNSYFDFTKDVKKEYEKVGYKNLLENLYYKKDLTKYKNFKK